MSNARLCATMRFSALQRICVGAALSKSQLEALQWIILLSKETIQSCRLSLALDELFSLLTLLVLAEPIFDCLVIKFLLLFALCPG